MKLSLNAIREGLKRTPNRRKSTVFSAIVGVVDQLTLIVTGLVLVPLYFDILGIELYGLWLATGGILAWFSMFDITPIINQRIAHYYGKREYDNLTNYGASGLILFALLTCCIGLIGYGVSDRVPRWLSAPAHHIDDISLAFKIGIASFCLHVISSGSHGLINALQRSHLLLWIRPIGAVLQIAIIIIALLSGFGIVSIPLGMLVRNSILLLWALPLALVFSLSLNRHPRIMKEYVGDMLKNSPAMIGGMIAQGLNDRFQPTLITLLISPQLAAIYDVTQKVALFIISFLNRFSLAPLSSLSHLHSEGDSSKYSKYLRTLFAALMVANFFCMGGYILFNKSFITLWVGGDKAYISQLTVLIAAAFSIRLMVSIFRYYLISAGRISMSSVYMMLYSIVQILLITILLSVSGIVGVPIAGIISGGVFALIFLIKTSKVTGVEIFSAKQLFALAFVCLALFGLFYVSSNYVPLLGLGDFIVFLNSYLLFGALIALGLYMRRGQLQSVLFRNG